MSSVLFIGKAGAYPSGPIARIHSKGKLEPCLQIKTWADVTNRDKHPSLLRYRSDCNPNKIYKSFPNAVMDIVPPVPTVSNALAYKG